MKVDEKILLYNDYIQALRQYGLDASEFDLMHQTARNTAKRLGGWIYLPDGYKCSADVCIFEYTYEVPAPVVPEAPKAPESSLDGRNCEYWVNRCEVDGFTKACNIAQNLGCWNIESVFYFSFFFYFLIKKDIFI